MARRRRRANDVDAASASSSRAGNEEADDDDNDDGDDDEDDDDDNGNGTSSRRSAGPSSDGSEAASENMAEPARGAAIRGNGAAQRAPNQASHAPVGVPPVAASPAAGGPSDTWLAAYVQALHTAATPANALAMAGAANPAGIPSSAWLRRVGVVPAGTEAASSSSSSSSSSSAAASQVAVLPAAAAPGLALPSAEPFDAKARSRGVTSSAWTQAKMTYPSIHGLEGTAWERDMRRCIDAVRLAYCAMLQMRQYAASIGQPGDALCQPQLNHLNKTERAMADLASEILTVESPVRSTFNTTVREQGHAALMAAIKRKADERKQWKALNKAVGESSNAPRAYAVPVWAPPAAAADTRVCHTCNVVGHIAARCPRRHAGASSNRNGSSDRGGRGGRGGGRG